MMGRVPLIAVIYMAFGLSAVAAEGPQQLAQLHTSKGLTCSSCHGEGAKKPVAAEQCKSCHGSWRELGNETVAVLEPNPHQGHVGELACSECHHAHTASVLYCNICHSDLKISKKEKSH
jgi:fumarate reductase flavoprotein subunit